MKAFWLYTAGILGQFYLSLYPSRDPIQPTFWPHTLPDHPFSFNTSLPKSCFSTQLQRFKKYLLNKWATGCRKWNLACFPSTGAETSSVQFRCSVVSDCLWSHGLQHARPPSLSPTPRVYSNSCPLNRWCHPNISSSVIPFSSSLQSFFTPHLLGDPLSCSLHPILALQQALLLLCPSPDPPTPTPCALPFWPRLGFLFWQDGDMVK